MSNINYNLYLIGFMGAGKSTIARALQRELEFPLIEMDERIVAEQGMSINDIFAEYGEEHFRDIESALVETIAGEEPSIVSCGGGVVVRPQNCRKMKESGRIILLTATPQTVYERVKGSDERPILNGHMDVDYIAGLMEKRRELYQQAADLVVATDGRSREDIVQEILNRLEESGYEV
jgi:shikimate kinase